MGNDSHQADPTGGPEVLNEQLVAYLDGELDDEASRRIEERLTSDSTLRDQLSRLERTWDALDELERAEVDEEFTRTTIEMVALVAEEEREQEEQERPRRRRRWMLVGLAGLLGACLAGFGAVWGFWQDPNQKLIADLPVLERLDEYLQVDNIEFLKRLCDKRIFPADSDRGAAETPAAAAVSAGVGFGDTILADKQELYSRIENMPPEKKQQLEDKWKKFRGLSKEKQNQLRQLHRDLQAQENREELERVMKAYFDWALALSAPERSHLDSLTDPEERFQLVAKYRMSAHKPPWRTVGFPFHRGKDLDRILEFGEALKSWAGPYIKTHVDELAALLPADQQEKWKACVRRESVEKNLWQTLVPWYLAGPTEDLPITDADAAVFEKSLSADTKKWYIEASHDMKIEIRRGMRRMLHYLYWTGDPALKHLIDDEDLDAFERTLPPERREGLARLPEESRRVQLRYGCFLAKLPVQMRDDRNEGFGPGRGGPPRGDQRREGSQDPRRGLRGEPRDRDEGSRPGELRQGRSPMPAPFGPVPPNRPGMPPHPGSVPPDGPGMGPPPDDRQSPSGQTQSDRPGVGLPLEKPSQGGPQ